jgi:serine-type D-Ala-D-Ala carboxypeptidase (penicillin-binding protein 5/6)
MGMSSARFPLFLALGFLLAAVTAAAAGPVAPVRIPLDESLRPPSLYARSAILLEARTGAILFEDNADAVIAPASLTKLMTLHIVLQEIATGRIDANERIVPGPDAWAKNMPPRSSLMFLGPRQTVSVAELLKGLAVASGNDAAVALADRVAGSVPAFVEMMNAEARRMGYREMRFVEPSGISARNTITAREYADFCRRFIERHPEALQSLFSLREFTYPLPENLAPGNHEKPITQQNRNVLLGRYEGADGLKTGYIDESGYNIAVTAERNGMRLISVILGEPARGRVSGMRLRTVESEKLLDYGFDNFTTVEPSYPPPAAVRVWKGRVRRVALQPSTVPLVVVPRVQAGQVRAVLEQRTEVIAPVPAGQEMGAVVVSLGGRQLTRFPLVAEHAVARGSLLRRALDSIALLFHRV